MDSGAYNAIKIFSGPFRSRASNALIGVVQATSLLAVLTLRGREEKRRRMMEEMESIQRGRRPGFWYTRGAEKSPPLAFRSAVGGLLVFGFWSVGECADGGSAGPLVYARGREKPSLSI